MKRIHFNSILLLLALVTPFMARADRFYIEPTDFELGKTETIQFILDNSQDYYGFQAEVTLPDGLEALKGSDGELDITLSSRAYDGNFRVNSNVLPDGSLIMGAFSTNHKAFTGNSGVLVNLKVSVADSFKGGSIEIADILLINNQNEDVEFDSTSSTIGVMVTGISLSETESSIIQGETKTLRAIITPESATDKSVAWTTSDDSVATVSDEGVVTAVKLGNATITATTSNGKTATCKVTVVDKAIEVTEITLSAMELSLIEGEIETLSATVTPENATDKSVTWTSSDTAVATVSAEGAVTAVRPGTATITATSSNGKTATCIVTVSAKTVEVSDIKLSLAELNLAEGETASLTVTVTPENATDKSVTWTSSDIAVATVSAEGAVTAVRPGTATITATSSNGKTATCIVTVSAKTVEVSDIKLSLAELNLAEGETASLTVTVTPENATDKSVTWTSSDIAVATVSAEGAVTAVRPGTATITATSSNGKTATCKVTVSAKTVEVSDITLNFTELLLTEGETAKLTATVIPENATDKSVTWTCLDASVATVSADGVVAAIKSGTTAIIASSSNGKIATCTLTVVDKAIEITDIVLGTTELNLAEGETATLTATVTPENATDKSLTWTSSDSTVATVSPEGVVTAVKAGTAVITVASSNGKTANCKVTVTDKAIEAIEVLYIALSHTELNLTEGETATLKAIITPENATDKSVTWTCHDAAVATVSAEGVVTAIKAGTTTITAASSNGKIATCKLTVSAKVFEVSSIILSDIELSLAEGETATLTATVTPENAEDKSITWTSSDNAVATVSAEGVVTAVKPGNATITATSSNGKSASCEVTVTALPVLAESLNIDPTIWNIEEGKEFTIVATILPDNATDKTVAYESSDVSVATVDAEGHVVILKDEICVITVSTLDGSDLKAECVIAKTSGIDAIFADPKVEVDVFDMNGVLLKRSCTSEQLKQFNPAVYILRSGNTVRKIVIR